MTDQPIPRIGAKAKCRHCGEQIIYEPWFRDGRGPNPPVWAHTKGPRTCGTRPKGWRRDRWPFAEPVHACAHCGDTGHTWNDCQAYTRVVAVDEAPAPANLRQQYAEAIRTAVYRATGGSLDIATDVDEPAADAVLAVRDRELEQLRQRLALADHIHQENEAAIERVRQLADRWENALAPDLAYARTLRAALNPPEQQRCRRCQCLAGAPDCKHCNCCDVPDASA